MNTHVHSPTRKHPALTAWCRRVLIGATLTASLAARADYPSTILTDNPAGYWRLGDLAVGQSPFLATGDVAANSGAVGTPGNAYYFFGAAHPVPGALAGSGDTAVAFDAWKSRVDMPFNAGLNTTNFTVEMWVKITNTTGNRAVSPFFCRDTNSQRGLLFFANNATTKWQFRTYAGATARNISSTNDVQYSTWVHLVGTHENIAGVGSVMRFYLNGQLANTPLTNAVNSYTPNTAAPTRIGAGNTQNALADYFWPGSMDEVAVYTNTLSAAQVLAHYDNGTNASRGTPYETLIAGDNPAGYWRFNEPAGSPTLSTPAIANTGSAGTSANGIIIGVTNSAAPIPGVTNNVVTGATGVVSGDANTSLQMNGKGGMVAVPYLSSLNPASFTVECWARLDGWAASHQSPVSARNGLNLQNGFIIYAAPLSSNPRWEFWTGPGWQTVAGPMVTIGQWYHIVGTYDADTTIKLFYVDGQLVGGAAGVSVTPNGLMPLRIGAGENETGGNFFWNGLVDEVAVYPGAILPSRVSAHYQAGAGAPPAATTAPTLSLNPVNQTNWAPYSVTLRSIVLGSLPMQLQWYHVSPDGTTTNAVLGATNLVLTLNPTATSDTGNYYLAATNSVGGTESTWAWVEIFPPTQPSLTLDLPAIVPVYVGGTAGLDATAAGTPPITYLLQSNSVPVATSTNGFFKISKVQPSYATTDYRIVATNLFGVTPSSTCKLQVLTAPAATYAAAATNLNPAGYWRLGEDSGTSAFDYWSGMNGDYVGSYPNTLPGALVDDDDGCVQQYGTGSYVRVRDAKAFNYNGTTNRFTMTAWIKADSWPTTGARFFSTRLLVGNTGGYGFGVWNGNSFRFTAFGVTDVAQGLPTMNVGQWYHVAAVCSNLTVYFYLNGVYQGAGNGAIGATGIKTSPYPLQLGGNPNFALAADEEPFPGQMDEAAVFGRVLTTTEIKSLYDARYGSLVAPAIVREPASVQLFTGGTARFSVEANGSLPLAYQWKSNGVPITGATNTSLVIAGVAAGMNGISYSVTVTNRAGTTNSVNAALNVQAASGYAAAVVQDNPAGLWRLGEAPASTTAYDAWGSHNGAVIGNVTFAAPGAIAADPNTAASFDGTAPTRVEVSYAPELNSTNFSVECWTRVAGGAGRYRSPVSSRNEVQGGSQGGYILYATDANLWSFWTGGDGAGWQSLNGPAVVENEWTHLVATYDGTTKRLYVNGTLVAAAVQIVNPNPIRPLRMGAGKNEADPGDYFFPGDVDEVAVYGTVLSPERVAYHYNLGKYSTTTPPFITKEPASQTIQVGGSTSLSVQAGGSPALTYQWLKDGIPLTGATQAALAVINAAYADNGSYRVAIQNAVGSTNSATVTLAVMPPPLFANLTNDLVLHLEFETNPNDTSGRGNHGVTIGAPGYVSGALGTNALHYSTDTGTFSYNYVTLGTPPDLAFSTNINFSVAYWVRFTGLPGDLPFLGTAVGSYGNNGLSFAPGYNTGTWSYYILGATGPGVSTGYATAAVNDGNWHSLVHTFDRTGNAVTYLDGAQVDVRSFAAVGDLDNLQPMTIGQDPTGTYAETAMGDIDDVGIWRRVLSPYEAQSIYTVGHNYGRSFNTYGPVRVLVQTSGSSLQIIWQAGTLEQNSDLNNPAGWTTVPGAAAPFYQIPPGTAQKFYRVKL